MMMRRRIVISPLWNASFKDFIWANLTRSPRKSREGLAYSLVWLWHSNSPTSSPVKSRESTSKSILKPVIDVIQAPTAVFSRRWDEKYAVEVRKFRYASAACHVAAESIYIFFCNLCKTYDDFRFHLPSCAAPYSNNLPSVSVICPAFRAALCLSRSSSLIRSPPKRKNLTPTPPCSPFKVPRV